MKKLRTYNIGVERLVAEFPLLQKKAVQKNINSLKGMDSFHARFIKEFCMGRMLILWICGVPLFLLIVLKLFGII